MFIGSSIYDPNLYEDIQREVENVIAKDNEIEFLFSRRALEFYYLSFWAVLKSKHQYPDKKITMTLITMDKYEEKLLSSGIRLFGIPTWIFDKIIPVPNAEKQSVKYWNKLERKMVCRSNYIITHCYPEFHSIEYNLFKYSMNQKNVTVTNLLSDETQNCINKTIKLLSKSERLILEQINSGYTYASLARDANVPVSTIKAKYHNGRKLLKLQVLNNLHLEQIEHKKTIPGKCSIILPDCPINESDTVRLRLQEIIHFLTTGMDVTSFMITPCNCLTYVKDLFINASKINLTIITSFTEQAKSEFNMNNKQYFSAFAKVQNINYNVKSNWARYLFSIKSMIEQSEYIICNLSDTTHLENRIKRYINKQKNITVINLGNSPKYERKLLI